ncbi:MAG: c-type cytochrome [Bryobacteraceae bacterium]
MRFPALWLLVAAAAWPQRVEEDNFENPLNDKADAVVAGQKQFVISCSACHGATGEGGRGPNIRDGRAIRRLSDRQLFTSIQKGVPGTDMPPVNLPDEKIWQVAAFVRALSAPAFETRVAGDVEAGRAIFFGKGACSQCHMILGNGGFLGPDLSNIGAARSLEYLRESVAKPGARLADGYQGVRVVTRQGVEIEGVARNYSNYSIQITDARGELHLLDTANLKEVRLEEKTLMPEPKLAPAEIRDVLAYLSRHSVRPTAPKSSELRRQRGNRR